MTVYGFEDAVRDRDEAYRLLAEAKAVLDGAVVITQDEADVAVQCILRCQHREGWSGYRSRDGSYVNLNVLVSHLGIYEAVDDV